jgi:hypothetical protein
MTASAAQNSGFVNRLPERMERFLVSDADNADVMSLYSPILRLQGTGRDWCQMDGTKFTCMPLKLIAGSILLNLWRCLDM